jgi:hypothetical protein
VLAAGTTDSGKLFVTGYSQGGHVAMATHRAMQVLAQTDTTMTVTASAGMSGPYALAAFGDAIMYGTVDLGSTVFTPMLVTSFQHSYGNIYAAASDVYESAFATGIDNILPSTSSLTTLFTTGKLPQLQLFKNTDWTGVVITGTAADAQLDAALNVPNHPLYSLGFGPNNLVKDTFRKAYILDAAIHPDGAVPSVSATIPLQTATAPANTLRIAFKTNDLRTWKPNVPMMLCGGSQDPTVFYPPNTTVIQNYFALVQGYPTDPTHLTVLDLEAAAGTPGPTNPFYAAKLGFQNAVGQVAGAGGASAVTQAYHGTLVPPFCSAAVRGFFGNF